MDGGHATAAYEDRKRTYHNTEALCRMEGLQLLPLVAEACGGGWGAAAMRAWRAMGRLTAARSGEAPGTVVEHLLQSLAITLQRENARVVLRRAPGALQPLATSARLEPDGSEP